MKEAVISKYVPTKDAPITIIDVANYFLLKENMTQKKLQKLAYYAYAWFYALNDEELVSNCNFEAWVHGPVNRDLRKQFGKFGWMEIKITEKTIEKTKKRLDLVMDNSIRTFLEQVWETYKDKTGDQLEQLTHSEKPWKEKRIGLRAYEPSRNIISKETMRNFYLEIMG